MESLSPKVIQSGLWSLGGNWIARGIGVIKLIILARLLTPLEFGILGLATLSINVLNVFSETGIESALIQKNKICSTELNTAWTISLIRGLVLFLILFVSARWFAFYFGHSTLEPVLKLMAVVFIVGGFVNIGLVYFQRELAFKKTVSLDLVSDITGAVATILLAFWLRNVWALVIGNIIWAITKCIGSYSLHSYRPKFFWDWSVAKNLLNFGKHIFWISIVTFIVTSGDDALVGKLLGLTALGFYTMAYNIANMLVSSLSGIIGRISFPAYSILQNEPQRLTEAFARVIEAVLIFLLPLTVLIILLAEDFTLIFLGDQWLPMVPVLKILALLGFFRGLANVFSPIQLAVNRPEIQSRNKTVELFLFLLLVYPFTIKWGLIGASWAVTTVYMVGAIISAISCASVVPLFFAILLKASWIPLLASSGIIISTWLIHNWLNAAGGLVQFLLSAIFGFIVLGVIVITSRKNLLRTIIVSVQEVRSSHLT
jgi:O-antigen/teichoic acid export membrane protein